MIAPYHSCGSIAGDWFLAIGRCLFFRSTTKLECLYSDFLSSEGDFDIKLSEWKAFPQNIVPEDITKTAFTFTRGGDFLHPRTSMLMFGPKNALSTQNHYLYVTNQLGEHQPPAGEDVNEWLERLTPVKLLVMTITQFDSIPMADVFKVVQYWAFESVKAADGTIDFSRVSVRVGLNVHFVKYTMIKSQISQGTQMELVVMSKSWCTYAKKRMQQRLAVQGAATPIGEAPPPVSPSVDVAASTQITSVDTKTSPEQLLLSSQQMQYLILVQSALILFLLLVVLWLWSSVSRLHGKLDRLL